MNGEDAKRKALLRVFNNYAKNDKEKGRVLDRVGLSSALLQLGFFNVADKENSRDLIDRLMVALKGPDIKLDIFILVMSAVTSARPTKKTPKRGQTYRSLSPRMSQSPAARIRYEESDRDVALTPPPPPPAPKPPSPFVQNRRSPSLPPVPRRLQEISSNVNINAKVTSPAGYFDDKKASLSPNPREDQFQLRERYGIHPQYQQEDLSSDWVVRDSSQPRSQELPVAMVPVVVEEMQVSPLTRLPFIEVPRSIKRLIPALSGGWPPRSVPAVHYTSSLQNGNTLIISDTAVHSISPYGRVTHCVALASISGLFKCPSGFGIQARSLQGLSEENYDLPENDRILMKVKEAAEARQGTFIEVVTENRLAEIKHLTLADQQNRVVIPVTVYTPEQLSDVDTVDNDPERVSELNWLKTLQASGKTGIIVYIKWKNLRHRLTLKEGSLQTLKVSSILKTLSKVVDTPPEHMQLYSSKEVALRDDQQGSNFKLSPGDVLVVQRVVYDRQGSLTSTADEFEITVKVVFMNQKQFSMSATKSTTVGSILSGCAKLTSKTEADLQLFTSDGMILREEQTCEDVSVSAGDVLSLQNIGKQVTATEPVTASPIQFTIELSWNNARYPMTANPSTHVLDITKTAAKLAGQPENQIQLFTENEIALRDDQTMQEVGLKSGGTLRAQIIDSQKQQPKQNQQQDSIEIRVNVPWDSKQYSMTVFTATDVASILKTIAKLTSTLEIDLQLFTSTGTILRDDQKAGDFNLSAGDVLIAKKISEQTQQRSSSSESVHIIVRLAWNDKQYKMTAISNTDTSDIIKTVAKLSNMSDVDLQLTDSSGTVLSGNVNLSEGAVLTANRIGHNNDVEGVTHQLVDIFIDLPWLSRRYKISTQLTNTVQEIINSLCCQTGNSVEPNLSLRTSDGIVLQPSQMGTSFGIVNGMILTGEQDSPPETQISLIVVTPWATQQQHRISVTSNTTIKEVIDEVCGKISAEEGSIELTKSSSVLSEDQKICNFEIHGGDVILAQQKSAISSQFEVTVVVPWADSNNKHVVLVKKSQLVSSVVTMVATLLKVVPEYIQLSSSNNLLESDQILSNLNISKNDILVVTCSKSFDIVISIPWLQTHVTTPARYNQSIGSIAESVPVAGLVRLLRNKHLLDPQESIYSSNISPGDVLTAQESTEQHKAIDIVILCPWLNGDKQQVVISINNKLSVRELFESVRRINEAGETSELSRNNESFVLNNQTESNQITLQPGDIITAKKPSHNDGGNFFLYVPWEGKKFKMSSGSAANLQDTRVKSLRDTASGLLNIPLERLELITQSGKKLTDNETGKDFNLSHNDVITIRSSDINVTESPEARWQPELKTPSTNAIVLTASHSPQRFTGQTQQSVNNSISAVDSPGSGMKLKVPSLRNPSNSGGAAAVVESVSERGDEIATKLFSTANNTPIRKPTRDPPKPPAAAAARDTIQVGNMPTPVSKHPPGVTIEVATARQFSSSLDSFSPQSSIKTRPQNEVDSRSNTAHTHPGPPPGFQQTPIFGNFQQHLPEETPSGNTIHFDLSDQRSTRTPVKKQPLQPLPLLPTTPFCIKVNEVVERSAEGTPQEAVSVWAQHYPAQQRRESQPAQAQVDFASPTPLQNNIADYQQNQPVYQPTEQFTDNQLISQQQVAYQQQEFISQQQPNAAHQFGNPTNVEIYERQQHQQQQLVAQLEELREQNEAYRRNSRVSGRESPTTQAPVDAMQKVELSLRGSSPALTIDQLQTRGSSPGDCVDGSGSSLQRGPPILTPSVGLGRRRISRPHHHHTLNTNFVTPSRHPLSMPSSVVASPSTRFREPEVTQNMHFRSLPVSSLPESDSDFGIVGKRVLEF